MPPINTENNHSLISVNNTSPLSAVSSQSIHNISSLVDVINTSSTFRLPSSPPSFHQRDMQYPLFSQLRSVEVVSYPESTFPASGPACNEPMEVDVAATQHLPLTTTKRLADIPVEPLITAQKRTRTKTDRYQSEAKNLSDDEEARRRLLARLPEEIKQWHARHPAEKNKEGKNSIKSVAEIYRTHKDFLVEHDVKQEDFAKLYMVNQNYLVTTISKSRRSEGAICFPSADNNKFLQDNPVEKTADGKYQATTVARYFIKYTTELEAQGISPEMLAKYTKTDPETLRKRISWARNNVVVSLPVKIKNWLKKHRIVKGDNGKVIQRHFKTLWENHQQEINRLGITLENMAAYNRTNARTLTSIIESSEQLPYCRTPKPTEDQKNYLNAQLWQRDSAGNIIPESVAKFYIENKKELMKRKITREMLAVTHSLKPSALILRIDKNPLRAADMQWKQQQVESWLEKFGPDKNQLPKKIPEKAIAKFFWEIKKIQEDHPKVSASDLIRFYGARQSVLHYHIDRCDPDKAKELPTSEQNEWLKKNAPPGVKSDVLNIEIATEYYVKNQDQLRTQGITNKKLAAYYGIAISTFKSRIMIARQANTAGEIAPEIQQFLRYVAQQTELNENSSKQLASMMLDYAPPFEINLATAAIITDQLGVNFAANTLMRRINEVEKIRKAANNPLSSEATEWLNAFDAEYEHGMYGNATKAAMFWLQYQDIIKAFTITPYQLALRYGFSATTLQTTVIRPKIIKKAANWQPEKRAPSPDDVKQEPEEHEVRPWNQAKWGRYYPVVMSPGDTNIILGFEQGPLQELLTEENVATLKFINYPAEYRRYQKGAIRQVRDLVIAAQNGTLGEFIKQQGKYYLLCDYEHPELGMGLAAACDLAPGEVLNIYPGVKFSGHQQFLEAATSSDVSYPDYAFEHSGFRPRAKTGAQKKKPVHTKIVISGQYQTGDMVFANTAKIDANGKVKPSESNNLVALKSGKAIITYMTTCAVKKHDPLLVFYGDKYRINPHKPYPMSSEIKQEISEFEDKLQQLNINQPALGWLVNNIHHPGAWTHPAFELMPFFLAQTPSFRRENALLVLTDQEGIIFKIIDSATGMDVEPETALYSQRPLAVLQNQGENHYNCWWAKGRNVSFSLAQAGAGNRLYQVEIDDPCNFRQAIAPSGFCMSEAAAMALMARAAKKPLLDADRQKLGQRLREQVRDFILAADDALCHALEAQIPQQ